MRIFQERQIGRNTCKCSWLLDKKMIEFQGWEIPLARPNGRHSQNTSLNYNFSIVKGNFFGNYLVSGSLAA